MFTGSENQPPTSQVKPRDTPIIPRRPPRRRLDRSRHKSLTTGLEMNFPMEETIAEVESPVGSPSMNREPKVPMPGDPASPRAEKQAVPTVPMPGQPRVPSPSSTGWFYFA